MLRGGQALKNNKPSTVADFFGFENWDEVVEFSKNGEGEHLQTFVNLVESRGEKQLMWALNRIVDEEMCDIIISTAHKAKGREWSKVRLMDDFLKSSAKRLSSKKNEEINGHDPAELRLFYVALTRAKEEMEVPSNLMSLLRSDIRPLQPETNFLIDRVANINSYTTLRYTQEKAKTKLVVEAPSSETSRKIERKDPLNRYPEPKPVQPNIHQPVIEEKKPPKMKGFFKWLFGL